MTILGLASWRLCLIASLDLYVDGAKTIPVKQVRIINNRLLLQTIVIISCWEFAISVSGSWTLLQNLNGIYIKIIIYKM